MIDKFKFGFFILEDIFFEDLSNVLVIDIFNVNGIFKNLLDSCKGTVFDKKRNKKDKKGGGGLFGIFLLLKVFVY